MCWYEQLDEKVREYLPDMTMEREVPLSRHTSFRIGGPARPDGPSLPAGSSW